MSSKLVVAAAGSGKTTYLVNEALNIRGKKVLITTFTEANEREIQKKFIELNGCIPSNVTVQTWFSFLLQHGVRPYQSAIYDEKVIGLLLVNQKSGRKGKFRGKPIYYGEEDTRQYYFSKTMQIYSDKISKFVYRANELSGGLVIDRIHRIFPYIFIDEVQDLAGYDLELVKLMLLSNFKLLMVGDPRQVTYHTHDEAMNKKYSDGKIVDFIEEQCKKCDIEVDCDSLNTTFRNFREICVLANQIYTDLPACNYVEHELSGHDGVFWIKRPDIEQYLEAFHPIQLRDKSNVAVSPNAGVMTFGEAKGLTFERVLIYPTKPMREWFVSHDKELKNKSKAKLYVAITRARKSVGIVYDTEKDIAGCKDISVFTL